MLHPSYVELMKVVNDNVVIGEEPVVNSRYSIVCATAKRARQIIDGSAPLVSGGKEDKPLSTAVKELFDGDLKILSEDEALELEKLQEVRLKALAEAEAEAAAEAEAEAEEEDEVVEEEA